MTAAPPGAASQPSHRTAPPPALGRTSLDGDLRAALDSESYLYSLFLDGALVDVRLVASDGAVVGAHRCGCSNSAGCELRPGGLPDKAEGSQARSQPCPTVSHLQSGAGRGIPLFPCALHGALAAGSSTRRRPSTGGAQRPGWGQPTAAAARHLLQAAAADGRRRGGGGGPAAGCRKLPGGARGQLRLVLLLCCSLAPLLLTPLLLPHKSELHPCLHQLCSRPHSSRCPCCPPPPPPGAARQGGCLRVPAVQADAADRGQHPGARGGQRLPGAAGRCGEEWAGAERAAEAEAVARAQTVAGFFSDDRCLVMWQEGQATVDFAMPALQHGRSAGATPSLG